MVRQPMHRVMDASTGRGAHHLAHGKARDVEAAPTSNEYAPSLAFNPQEEVVESAQDVARRWIILPHAAWKQKWDT